MLKFSLYFGLTLVGMGAALASPLWGGIACIQAYLLNPSAIAMADFGMRYQLLTTAAFVAGYILHRPRGVPRAGREGYLIRALWLFLFIGALSSFWAVVSAEVALDNVLEVAKTILFVTLLVSVVHTVREFEVVFFACIVGVWHAATIHTFGDRLGYLESRFGREYGVLPDDHNSVMLLFAPAVVLLCVTGSKWRRMFGAVTLVFLLNSVVYTYQRAGLVALAAQGVMMFLLWPGRVRLRLLPWALAALAVFMLRLTPDNYWEWMSTLAEPEEEASASSRMEINRASMQMLLDHPMGVGYRNYPVVSPQYLDPSLLTQGRRSAHNSFFTIACETGVAGFAVWMFAILGAAWSLRDIRKRAKPNALRTIEVYAMGMELGLYGWMVFGLAHSGHEVDPAYWFVAFTVVLVRLWNEERRKEDTDDRRMRDMAERLEHGPRRERGARRLRVGAERSDRRGLRPPRVVEAKGYVRN